MKIMERLKSSKKKENTERSIVFIPTGELIPLQNNIRNNSARQRLEGLTDSIQKFGIIHPVIVRERENIPFIEIGGEKIFSEAYEIISGERRWRAAMLLGMDKVPCIIYRVSSRVALEMFLSENIQRNNLHFTEEARGAERLIDNFNATSSEAAEAISVTRPCLANRFRFFSLSEAEQNEIIKSNLSERHVMAFTRIESKEKRLRLIEQAITTSMSAPEAERAAEEIINPISRTKGDSKRKIAVISDVGFFLNSLNRAICILEESGIKVDKKELESEDTLEISLKIKRKAKK